MITLEEMKAQGLKFAGQDAKPDFILSSRTDAISYKNIRFYDEIQRKMNIFLEIKNYSFQTYKHITFIFIVLKEHRGGVNWEERKTFDRKNNHLRLELKLSDYDRFCNATREEALKILAQETLRGIEKFLTKVKDFDFPKFYADVKELFEKEFGI